MNREQAINYLFSCGFTNEQVGEVVRALTYEPTTKNNLGVEEVTALAEWTEKLTKASEDAYNKGYSDGMKAQEPTIKALGEELRKARKGIADEKVLIGYNMAVAICNKHLGESEVEDGNDD